ncbi:MAG: type II secretion system F family protein [Candidatus Thermoplasmatota archaeon]|nr:type II secretion system F family protein [Candidatus Thermoplasmatota archaeon]MBS3801938.1 type II secretion system F family protein [Candidatus Thermoplasmatota archaeon]
MLSTLQKKAYAWFGVFTQKHASDQLKQDVSSAHMNINAEAYMAEAFIYTIISFIVFLSAIFLLSTIFFPLFNITLSTQVFLTVLGASLVGSIATYFIFLKIPALIASGRGKKIDMNLCYALNFVAAMSSAGVTPTEIFKSLSQQSIYGEVQKEASWIYRDATLLGKDIITSIRENMHRTPSEKFKEFLQGLIVTVTSGGSLKSYFSAKSKQFMIENRQKQKQTIESLGIMAESYVTAAVAGILLLFIVIPLMMIISGDASQMILLYVMVFLMVPIIHGAFAFVIRMMSLEA